jgi:hypothetical protein
MSETNDMRRIAIDALAHALEAEQFTSIASQVGRQEKRRLSQS